MTLFKTRFMGFALALGATCLPLTAFADAAPPSTRPALPDATEDCAKELLLSYYPPEFVKESLKKYHVPPEKWDEIIDGLKQKDQDVIRQVEEKAGQLNPNPLKDPQQRQQAIKIFKDTLYEVFASVLKPAGVTDDKTIQNILDDVQQQKAKRFAQCIEKRKTAPAPAAVPAQ